VQAAFTEDVKLLTSVTEEMGNPFIEEGQDLLVLDTRGIVDANVAETVRKAEILGEEENSKFVDERLIQRSKPITETLHKTDTKPYEHCLVAHLPNPLKAGDAGYCIIERLQSHFQLYVTQDLDRFFAHENKLPHHHCHLEAGCSSIQTQTFFVVLNRTNPDQ